MTLPHIAPQVQTPGAPRSHGQQRTPILGLIHVGILHRSQGAAHAAKSGVWPSRLVIR